MLDTPPKNVTINKIYYKKTADPVSDKWDVPISTTAKNCRNYIREIVDNLNLEPNPNKKVIALSIGDPTVYGNLVPAKETTDALIETVLNGKHNGYGGSCGLDCSRNAVAEYLSYDGVEVQAEDVILCSGCSSSLDLCITVLADGTRGQNILVPKPGFPIYRTLAESMGVEVRHYDLLPEENWELDLDDVESKIDSKTAAIVINNPSNPCGSVYSEEHLRNVLRLAERNKIPIIADEIYERLVFPGNKFVSVASLGAKVPLLICGGLAKRFLVPGWRLGWIVVHDPVGAFAAVRKGLVCLSQRIIGSNTLVQGAMTKILLETPQSFHDELMNTLIETANIAYEEIGKIRGLKPFMPQGAMYMMVQIKSECFPQFNDGLEFVSKLMEEESTFCLPGEAFGLGGYMRIIITVPKELMVEACERLANFCNKYYKPKPCQLLPPVSIE
ncbi:PREDICTED: tyrosine aminotransferase-like [Nicrophorus vespilloides]|uniref:Tyrosine aminotransferase n=1 Tax=Nicrophorus vespilloides TaxID=110193 RepID=A0ABM1M021_NICVS|nr:PREDICTED: tyrosine aminotransferase-like [Nicrophorus vespilloides]